MTGPCNRVRDQAPGSELDASLAEHVAICEECARMLALRAQARDTWRRARARDDESLARQRERRILNRVSDRKRGYGARTTGVLIIALGLLAATAAAIIANRHRALEETTSSFREPEAARAPSRGSTSTPSLPAEAPVASSAPEQSMPAAPAQEARHAMTPAVTHGGQADDAESVARGRGGRRARRSDRRRGVAAGAAPEAEASSLSSKAGLRLAELLLARGATVEARERLDPLVFGGGGPIANDAVWLYAQSFADARDRADAWARFLATNPAHRCGTSRQSRERARCSPQETTRPHASSRPGSRSTTSSRWWPTRSGAFVCASSARGGR